ncbi:Indoleamine 2,3-dioxygenase [Pilobolus umbonatus]|nr:Indoleamine 2,3-dioxygenase [Pilobolus umbonatus]
MRSIEQYDISPLTGFLPSTPPLRRLPQAYYAPWETLMDDFNGLLLAGRLREKVHKLPLLDPSQLNTVEEYRRAFLVLCMICHGYIWGKLETASEVLPDNLAIPWTKVASELGLNPVVCHAAVVLWNYKLLDQDGSIDLSNLSALSTFSGSTDEAWFYLTTVSIEYAGAPSLGHILQAIDNVKDANYAALKKNLEVIRDCISHMTGDLKRMFERCDPYVFYWKIRPYLAGWENMAEGGLPHGVIYEGVDPTWSTDEYADMSHLKGHYRKYAGGSAAQSSLVVALDIALGIKHRPTGSCTAMPSPEQKNTFFMAMRQYMPRPHREFLEDLEESANIRPLILQLEDQHRAGGVLTQEELEIIEVYNACLHELKLFRDKHVQVVTMYIVNQARKQCPVTKQSTIQTGLARSIGEETEIVRGTGGTNLIPFLKQSRDETTETKIDLTKTTYSLSDSLQSWSDWILRR